MESRSKSRQSLASFYFHSIRLYSSSMPADDYTAAVSGGLKLKGVNSSSKVSKHKKKNPKAEANPTDSDKPKVETPTSGNSDDQIVSDRGPEAASTIEREGEAASSPARAGKTEAELRHEERRRKRVGLLSPSIVYLSPEADVSTILQLDERLKREGTKTHKERVEELNRYLSNLSEHHDMPRIGPG